VADAEEYEHQQEEQQELEHQEDDEELDVDADAIANDGEPYPQGLISDDSGCSNGVEGHDDDIVIESVPTSSQNSNSDRNMIE